MPDSLTLEPIYFVLRGLIEMYREKKVVQRFLMIGEKKGMIGSQEVYVVEKGVTKG